LLLDRSRGPYEIWPKLDASADQQRPGDQAY
jgi:hypothetical protein